MSLRQTEDLFQILLPPGQVPDHSTIGRWVKTEAKRAAEVLQVLDQKCATKVQTLVPLPANEERKSYAAVATGFTSSI